MRSEADAWAAREGRDLVGARDVELAVEAQQRRVGRLRERSLEEIQRGTVMIDTDGAVVGQVNGLSVWRLGELRFGRPVRITARVRFGRGQLVDIEREVELGGPVHSKGVLILSGFLGARYAQDFPHALSASLDFEQSYGGGHTSKKPSTFSLTPPIACTWPIWFTEPVTAQHWRTGSAASAESRA